jgi:polyphosphate kinase 2 (PPK2 family)
VLVERVEGYCTPADWQRAYSEINDFEHELVDAGTIVVKFWLQISQEEQLRRFKEREQIAFKRFKITEEDWRNREKWDAYQLAICDMVERNSTGDVPWTLVESNDKNYARVKILRTLCERLEQALNASGGKAPKTEKAPKAGKAAKAAKSKSPDRNEVQASAKAKRKA